ncbi:response regulator [Paenibacillus alginolyticus]|uniref:Response regulator n=1 Tax=Paenibacillus alginolyticus TaxID=59839 RepID=A0ABT4GHT8_9BACL|nr:response regulator [Paenibacillus alginolyticus]MCY9663944.1 response regulator [Paenibacillus alginolyticus]MCY9695691.1 response regulator [Paenibacillus alginolyticus]MEC0142229.1 response regulator [Paenibacillus alginolyticus]
MKKRILVVDDAAFMRAMLKDILVNLNYEVVAEGRNGHEAVHLYKRYKPDLVTLDITMPEMDGIDALKEIIRFDHQAKVIMCSAMGQQKLVVDSIQAGAKDFLVKPFNKDRIATAIESVNL